MEATSLHCPCCGAAVDLGAERCAYCRTSLLVRADAAFDEAGAGIETHWPCPACKAMLRSHARNGWAFERCPACRGLWLGQDSLQHLWDHPEAEQVAASWAAAVDEAAGTAEPAGKSAAFYPACPECATPMNRVNCGGGVIVDVCREHGAWFDAGELARLGAGLRPGGVDPAHLHQVLGRMSYSRVHTEGAELSEFEGLADVVTQGVVGHGVLGVVGGIVLGAVLGSLSQRN